MSSGVILISGLPLARHTWFATTMGGRPLGHRYYGSSLSFHPAACGYTVEHHGDRVEVVTRTAVANKPTIVWGHAQTAG